MSTQNQPQLQGGGLHFSKSAKIKHSVLGQGAFGEIVDIGNDRVSKRFGSWYDMHRELKSMDAVAAAISGDAAKRAVFKRHTLILDKREVIDSDPTFSINYRLCRGARTLSDYLASLSRLGLDGERASRRPWVEKRIGDLERSLRDRLFVDVAHAVLSVLSAMRPVCHCDVKPDNIMVCEDGGAMAVKLIDFGVASRKVCKGMTYQYHPSFFADGFANLDMCDAAKAVIGEMVYEGVDASNGSSHARQTNGCHDLYSLGITLLTVTHDRARPEFLAFAKQLIVNSHRTDIDHGAMVSGALRICSETLRPLALPLTRGRKASSLLSAPRVRERDTRVRLATRNTRP